MKKNYIPWLVGAAAVLIAVCIGIYFLNRPKSAAPRISKAEQARRDSISLKVALMPTFACLPFYYADDTGIYDSLGLDVKMLTFQAQMDCDTALARGHVECSYTDVIRAARLQNRGTGLYMFMGMNEDLVLVTQYKVRIRKLDELKEKMVGMARFSVTDYMLDALVDSAKVSDAEVYRPQINDVPLRGEMLCNEEIDAAILPEPYANMAFIRGKHRRLFRLEQMQHQMTGMMARYDALQDTARERQIELLIRGYNIAADKLNKLKKFNAIGKQTASRFPLDKNVRDKLYLHRYERAAATRPEDVAEAIKFLKRRGQLKGKYTGDTLITHKFLQP